MLGGTDIVISTRLTARRALAAAARAVSRRWPRAVYQCGTTGERYARYAAIPFGRTNELLIYKDPVAFERWEHLGADPSNDDTMMHLLAYESGRLTVVVDDEAAHEARVLLAAIRDLVTDESRARLMEAA